VTRRPTTGRAAALVLLSTCGPLLAADFEAGVARVKITPPTPFWMSGYAAPGPLAATVEDTIVDAVRRVLQAVGAKAAEASSTGGRP
jgi:hypothetical protein